MEVSPTYFRSASGGRVASKPSKWIAKRSLTTLQGLIRVFFFFSLGVGYPSMADIDSDHAVSSSLCPLPEVLYFRASSSTFVRSRVSSLPFSLPDLRFDGYLCARQQREAHDRLPDPSRKRGSRARGSVHAPQLLDVDRRRTARGECILLSSTLFRWIGVELVIFFVFHSFRSSSTLSPEPPTLRSRSLSSIRTREERS